MILKVPDDFKGSFVLSILEKACWAGMQIVVSGNDLYAPDIKAAIKKKMLVPFIKGEYDEYADTNHEVLIVNRTNRKLVLGSIVLNPKAALPIDRSTAENSIIQGAESDDLISIISDDDSFQNKNDFFEEDEIIDEIIDEENAEQELIDEEITEQEPVEEELIKEKSEEQESVKEEIIEEEKKTIAKIWNIREQKIEEAEMVNKISDQVIIEVEEKKEENSKKKKSVKKKKTKKKKTSKKKKTKKKKGKKKKKKNVKTIQPVGEVREKGNIAIELDSKGNPIEKPSDVLNHMIDEVKKNISFVDDEQKKERAEKRGIKTEDWE